MPGLNPRDQRFIDEYLIDLDPQRAALAAGYAKTTARSKAYQWVSDSKHKPHVYEAIERAKTERANRTGITADRVLIELGKLGFANLADYFHLTPHGEPVIDLTQATRDQLAALTEIQVDDFVDGRGENTRDVKRVRIRMADKKAALDLLAKHLGLYAPDRLDVRHAGTVNLEKLTDEQLRELVNAAPADTSD